MNDAWTDRLSEYVDGELTGEERALLDAHLVTCAACTTTLAELTAVVASARALPDRLPVSDLWPGIEARIAAFARDSRAAADREARGPGAPATVRSFRGARRGLVLSWPQLAAAGLALVVLSGGGAWYLARNARPAATSSPATGVATTTRQAAPEVANASAGAVDRELEQLEKELARRRNELDPETVRTIETNLKIIDLATTQARDALAGDPSNPYLKEHLSKTMKRKVELLKEATVLASVQ
jgi:anti-sigma factor RsiW